MRRYSSPVTADTSVVTTTETVAAVVSGVTTPRDGTRISLFGNLQILLGTNTTGVTLRFRRGNGITGTVVGEANLEQIATAAGSTESHTYACEDTPGDVASAQYSFTVQQTGASANGTISYAYAHADTDT